MCRCDQGRSINAENVSNASIGLKPGVENIQVLSQSCVNTQWGLGSHPAVDDCLQSSSQAPAFTLLLLQFHGVPLPLPSISHCPVSIMLCILPSYQCRPMSCVQRAVRIGLYVQQLLVGKHPNCYHVFFSTFDRCFFLYCCCTVEDLVYPKIFSIKTVTLVLFSCYVNFFC